jgi:hypothetical protein
MVTYGYVIFALSLVAVGIAIGDDNNAWTTICSFFLYLPLIGRVIGWW